MKKVKRQFNRVEQRDEIIMVALGLQGFSIDTIIHVVDNLTGKCFARSTVHRWLSYNGIMVRDYRNGLGKSARMVIDQIASKSKTKIKKGTMFRGYAHAITLR